MKQTICVDLDGVLADYSQGWQGPDHIGAPIPGAVEFVKKLNELGRVVIFTARLNNDSPRGVTERGCFPSLGDRVQFITDWLKKHGFKYDEVYCGIGKPVASAYIDDRAVPCRPAPAGGWESAPAEANKPVWRIAVEHTQCLIAEEDGFVSDSGTTV